MLPHSSEGGTTPPARGSRSWFDAWVESAYGADGFWRIHSPDAHFRTAAASGPMVAQMLAALVDRQEGVGSSSMSAPAMGVCWRSSPRSGRIYSCRESICENRPKRSAGAGRLGSGFVGCPLRVLDQRGGLRRHWTGLNQS